MRPALVRLSILKRSDDVHFCSYSMHQLGFLVGFCVLGSASFFQKVYWLKGRVPVDAQVEFGMLLGSELQSEDGLKNWGKQYKHDQIHIFLGADNGLQPKSFVLLGRICCFFGGRTASIGRVDARFFVAVFSTATERGSQFRHLLRGEEYSRLGWVTTCDSMKWVWFDQVGISSRVYW